MSDRYGTDVLSGGPATHRRQAAPEHPATPGLVVEDVQTGWVGAVVRVEKTGGQHVVVLQDRRGKNRAFPLGGGFWVDGRPVKLVAPKGTGPQVPTRTASGSRAVAGARARQARGSRLWVEGRHDAELVEKIWGDDLRIEGVVVEPLDGVDDLAAAVREFAPGPGRRLGILVDHLVEGTKEWRIAQEALRDRRFAAHIHVVGHPYIDIWQAVRPVRLGLDQWPHVPRGQDWKKGILASMGWPATDQADVARGWKRILGSVRDYSDLEPALLGRVEELIDFVTEPGA